MMNQGQRAVNEVERRAATGDAFWQKIEQVARNIDPERFESFWWYGSIMDPYNTGCDCEGADCVGRVWWVRNPGEDAVTAWDFLKAHPELTWEDVYEREMTWSIKFDPFPMFGPRSERRRASR
jgi:hypothetical protein